MNFSEENLEDLQARVGQQLETLAQHVDQWLIARNQIDEDDSYRKYEAATHLLDRFEDVARSKKKSLTPRDTRHSRLSSSTMRRLEDFQSKRSRKELALVGGDEGEELRELQQWQDEVNSWDLLRILSSLQYGKTQPEAMQAHAKRYDSKLHKYSSNSDLWTRFLLSEDGAREKKLVLEWLERCARDDQADIDTIFQQFNQSMGEGETGWSHGWLNTREQIKSHKRFTSLKGATPAKSVSLKAQHSSDLLVTQLDPDAPTRQGRRLEKEDENHDHAFWVVCYDMFRRGMTWEKILDWCEERNEGWRAASLGAAQDLPRDQSRLCLAGPYAGALWRRMCYKASQEVNADRYERATYGLLAGDVASVEPVCQTWTDWLYVNYNALLLSSFEQWLKKHHPERFPSIVSQKYALYDTIPEQSDDMDVDGFNTTLRILGNEKFADKSWQSLYLLQGSFVAHTFDKFAANLGIAIAQVYGTNETSLLRQPPASAPVVPFYQNCAQDIDTIRMAVHAFIIYRDLGFDMHPTLVGHADNIILCYINYLRELRKYEAIPTYAKCLSNDEVIAKALAKLLFDITDQVEQNQMVNLIDQAELDVVSVLTEQYIYALAELSPASEQDEDGIIDEFPLIEPAGDDWAGWRVSEAFNSDQLRQMMDDDRVLLAQLTSEEKRVIRSLQWFTKIQAPWASTFSAITIVMKQLLGSGRFLAALAVTKSIPVEDLSLHITPIYFDDPINVFEISMEAPEDEDQITLNGYKHESQKPEPAIGSPEFVFQAQVEFLKEQAIAAKEMQDLCRAIGELIAWRLMEDPLSTEAPAKAAAELCSENLRELSKLMRPLLHGFMATPVHGVDVENEHDAETTTLVSPADAMELQHIKRAYVPAILLAYNGALVFASSILGAETLLKCLELANLVADDEVNPELSPTIVEAGRMPDFVTSLALSQQRLIKLQQDSRTLERRTAANGHGGAKGKRSVVRKKRSGLDVKKREWNGETLDLWMVDA